jgi:peptide/nickel transport system ATP-binding protein/oligopeptide transport system ATP-binding protein
VSLLVAEHLIKDFQTRGETGKKTQHRAVNDVSLTLEEGETLALVGESGAGKSTLGRLVLRLIEPDSGSVVFDGTDLRTLKGKDLRGARSRMQMIFQDPFSSLDPRISVLDSVAEPLLVHTGMKRSARNEKAIDLLRRVGIGKQFLERFPSQLSGGQLQRVAIARALTLEPQMIVCDEPVAALDVSVRAQVLNLLKDLQEERGIAYLFISHDLALVEVIANRIAVMSKGEIVEFEESATLFRNAQHEYTKQLLSAIPRPGPKPHHGTRTDA